MITEIFSVFPLLVTIVFVMFIGGGILWSKGKLGLMKLLIIVGTAVIVGLALKSALKIKTDTETPHLTFTPIPTVTIVPSLSLTPITIQGCYLFLDSGGVLLAKDLAGNQAYPGLGDEERLACDESQAGQEVIGLSDIILYCVCSQGP
jgi:hypothetical protein